MGHTQSPQPLSQQTPSQIRFPLQPGAHPSLLWLRPGISLTFDSPQAQGTLHLGRPEVTQTGSHLGRWASGKERTCEFRGASGTPMHSESRFVLKVPQVGAGRSQLGQPRDCGLGSVVGVPAGEEPQMKPRVPSCGLHLPFAAGPRDT